MSGRGKILAKGPRIVCREAAETDVEDMMAMESHPDNRAYLGRWTRQRHLEALEDPGILQYIYTRTDAPAGGEKFVGYTLAFLLPKSNTFDLGRFAVREKGQGYGREIMECLLRYVFGELGADRFSLDVFPENRKAICLYESLGFRRVEYLRQSCRTDSGLHDQIIYTLSKEEYRRMR